MEEKEEKRYTLLLQATKSGWLVEVPFKKFEDLLAYCEHYRIEVTVGDVRIEP